jgi:hypothetical protein
MEILIIGIILVALMAYASTKIKNAARMAYEKEVFETEEFKIIKPDGFIIPVKENSEFLFETYSKDFAEDEAEKFNQCWAVVVENGETENSSEVVVSEKIEDDVTIKIFRKNLVNHSFNKTYELEISVLPYYQEQYSDRIKMMLESFSLK